LFAFLFTAPLDATAFLGIQFLFLGDVRREFVQLRSTPLHGTSVFYLRDALQEGCADPVAYAFLFLGLRPVGFSPLFPFCLVVSLLFL
jgi:hypothetical protein